jgi:glycolate oxidase
MQMPVPNPAVLDRRDWIVARLQEVLPADAVIHDPAETRAYECDALTAYRCPPLAVVLPYTTEQVAAALKRLPRGRACRWCRAGRAPRWPGGRCRPPTA